MRTFVAAFSVLFLSTLARADLLVESIDGAVTPKEIAAFKEHMKTLDLRGDNNHNNFVYGKAGNAAEACGKMFEITGDKDILDQLIKIADMMLAGRNDPDKGRILWTGNKELAWPNSPDATDEFLYAGTENGDVLGHIAYAAKLILDNKQLYSEKTTAGDTYLDHAKHLIAGCDKTVDTYLIPYLVDPQTQLYRTTTDERFKRLGDRATKSMGKGIPWNQQMMLNNGFQRLAECHAILNDDPKRVQQYDTLVKNSCEAFLKSLVHYDVSGHDCVKWSYASDDATLHYMEDAAHGGYDLLIVRHYLSGRYGIKKESLLPFANTTMYVINKNDGTFATRVDGVSKGNPNKSLHASYLPLAEFLPDLWPIAAKASLSRTKDDPLLTATILWMKHYRDPGKFPEPQN